jgi:uncharacterized protein with HEPN domain
MKHDVRAFLADAHDAAEGIEKRLHGVTLEQYVGTEDLRLITERLYITLAEALNAAAKVDSALTARVPNISEIIAFRNILVHRYRRIDPALVHALSIRDLPALRTVLSGILSELESK